MTKMMATEDMEQEALFEWAEWYGKTQSGYRILQWMYAIPNGGKRHIKTAALLKKTGVKAGVPDIFLPAMRGRYGGMYIEMKRRKGGTVSCAQQAYIEELRRAGYYVAVCKGYREAVTEIVKYLDLDL